MRNSIYSITLDEALTAVGGHHKYQWQSLVLCVFLCFTAGVSAYSVTFFMEKPGLKCEGEACDECVSPVVEGETYATPATEWSMICGRAYMQNALAILYLSGAAFGAMLLSGFEHSLGRRKSLHISVFGGVLTGIAITGAPYWQLLILALPWKGASDLSLVIIPALLVVETTDGVYRNWCLTGLFAAASTGFITAYFVGTFLPYWRFLSLFATFMYCFCFPVTTQVHESPRYLSAIKGKYLQARLQLQHIATVNQKPAFNDMLEGEKVIGYQQESEDAHLSNSSTRDATGKLVFVPITKGIVSVSQGETRSVKRYRHWHLLTLGSCRGQFVVGVVTWASLSLTYRSLWEVPGDGIPVVVAGMWLADLLFLAGSGYLVSHIGRLGISITYLAIGGLCTILTVAFISPNCHPEGLCQVERVIETLLLHTGRFCVKAEAYVLALYTLESFPTNVRLLAIGQYGALSALIWLLFPFIDKGLQAGKVSILLLCGVGELICSIISCLLSDVDVDELPDYVEEEKSEMSKPAELSQIEIQPSASEETSRRLKSTEPHIEVPTFQPIPEEHSQEVNKDTP